MTCPSFDRRRLRHCPRREVLLALLEQVLCALQPEALLAERAQRRGGRLAVGSAEYPLVGRRVVALGAGKASPGMAAALEEILGESLEGGLVVTRYGHARPTRRVRILEAGHPIPDEKGLSASREMLAIAEGMKEGDLAVGLFSGGGSALLPLPAGGLTLADLVEATHLLLRCGAPIEDVNTVRRHLSLLQGGGLAHALGRAAVVSLVLSDVMGDPLDSIASGPTAPDPTTFEDARRILRSHGLWERCPRPIREHIERGVVGEVPETLKPGDPAFSRVENILLAGVRTSQAVARREAEKRGFAVETLPLAVEGEARRLGQTLAAAGRSLAARGGRRLLVGSGETTVHVHGAGRGGRNQEVALSAALGLVETPGIVVACLATDGSDGPTDAAGALVDGETIERAERLGLSARRALEENDTYSLLRATGDLLFTGPTGTNVADLVLVAAVPSP